MTDLKSLLSMLNVLVYEIICIVYSLTVHSIFSLIARELPRVLSLLSLARLTLRKYCRPTKVLNNKLSWVIRNKTSTLLRHFSDKLNNNDFESVIKVHLCYFELRKIILKVEFLLIIHFKEGFLLLK